MFTESKNSIKFTRRQFLKGGAALAGAAMVPGLWNPTKAFAAKGDTLVIAAPATPQSLDCNFDVSLGTFDSIGALYDNLLEFVPITDPKVPTVHREDIAYYPKKVGYTNVRGKLAENWDLDPDGRWVRFHLRKGVKSNWGNELTADDVKWTWDRKLALGALGAFYTSTMGIFRPEQNVVEDRYTFSFRLDAPNPLLLRMQPNLYCPIYDSKKCKEVGGKDDPWARKFIENDSAGFGPYRLKRLVRGQQAEFTARDDYYYKPDKPYMKRVIFKEVPQSAARVSLLQGGAVDIAQYLQPLELIALRKASGVSVETVAATFMIWIELNAKIKPFDNVDVRQAMNYAMPQQDILKTVYQNLGSPLHACMPDIYPGWAGNYYTYESNLEKAKELLAQSGYANGFKTTLSYNAGDPVQEPIAILYQTSLKKIGVDLQLRKVPAATFYNNVTERKQPMIFYVDSPWCPDPGYSMTLYFHSKSYVNYSNYSNAKVDELIDATARTADMGARIEMMDQAQKIIMSEAPWAFIAYPNYSLARKSDLQGWTYYTSNNIRFQDFYREG
ncbi:MAG: ABC transporter substrate-binding protein [Planctomycetes bacterium]|nr:ABC transporter substrate-binding protein [Planctomycetota bacterium]